MVCSTLKRSTLSVSPLEVIHIQSGLCPFWLEIDCLHIGEMLASAGDDGNTILWVPSENHSHAPTFGDDALEDKETWRVKHMCRSSGSEIYDLAWSPDGTFFITGSMDNVARIYNAHNGKPQP